MNSVFFKNVDADKKQLFISAAGKIKTNKNPALILGLGGTGAEAVLRTKKIIRDRFYASNHNNECPENVEFLVIDTDPSVQQMEKDGLKFSKRHNEVLLMRNADIVHIIEHLKNFELSEQIVSNNQLEQGEERAEQSVSTDDDSKPPMKRQGEVLDGETSTEKTDCTSKKTYKEICTWFDTNVPTSRIVNGAAGLRQAGRLLLYLNIMKVKDAIYNKLKIIAANKSLAEDELNVYILFGVGGGTGSGIFIDIAYLVRMLIDEMGGNPNITGFIFLPDVSLAKHGIDLITENNIKLNGYAALSELDYFMEVDRRKNVPTSFIVHNYGNGLTVNWNKSIFEHCFLLGANDEDRRASYPPVEMAKNAVAETIWSLLADDKSGFDIRSFLSNTDPHSNAFRNSTKMQHCFKSYKYSVVGTRSYFFPYDEMTTYLLHVLAIEIQEKHLRPFSKMQKQDMDTLFATERSIKKYLKGKGNLSSVKFPENEIDISDRLYFSYQYIFDKKWSDIKKIYIKNGPKYLTDLLEECRKGGEKPSGKHAKHLQEAAICAGRLKSSFERDKYILKELLEVFSSFSYLKDDNATTIDKQNRQIQFRLGTPKEYIGFIELFLKNDNKIISQIISNFYSDIYDNTDIWFGNTNVEVQSYIASFFDNQFKILIKDAVKSFIVANTTYINQIIDELCEKCKLQFPFSVSVNSVDSGNILSSFVRAPAILDDLIQNSSLVRNQKINYNIGETENRLGQITVQVCIALEDYFMFQPLNEYFNKNGNPCERHFHKDFKVEYGHE